MIEKVLKSICKIFVPPATYWLPRYYYALKYLNLKSLKPNNVVLDAACGQGLITIKIAKNNIRTIGVDASEAAISGARKNAKKVKNNKKVDFRVAEITNLPFPNNFFDAVISLDTIEYIENDMRTFEEFARVLKSKGTLVVSVPHQIAEFEDENMFPEQKLLRKMVPRSFQIPLTDNGKSWLEETAKEKIIRDKRLRGYTIEDVEKKSAPWFNVIHSRFGLKRFSRLATDITYSIKGFDLLKSLIFPLARQMDEIFCKKDEGFLLIVKMEKKY